MIPTRDSEAFLAEAVDSVLAQHYRADRIEIVVVDDGSVDASHEILNGYGDRIRRVRHEYPRGVNAAVEAGLGACTGELITRLDADDVYTPDRLRVLTRALAERPDAGLVYSDMTVVDEQGEVLAPSFNKALGIEPVGGRLFGRLIRGNFVGAGAMMFRAELLDHILPFPPHLGVHDWWIALQVARVSPLVAVSRSLYLYRRHGGNLNLGNKAPESRLPLLQRELPLRRWLLRTVGIEEVGVEAMWLALRAFDALLAEVAALAGQSTTAVVEEAVGDREACRAAMSEASDALDRGDLLTAMERLIRAAAEEPGDRQSRDLISQLMPHLRAAPAAA